jgi:hypothetical protein
MNMAPGGDYRFRFSILAVTTASVSCFFNVWRKLPLSHPAVTTAFASGGGYSFSCICVYISLFNFGGGCRFRIRR